MTKKGLVLFSIIFIGYLLKILVIELLPNFVDMTIPRQYLVSYAPFKLFFGLIVPLIFITQFKHRSIYYTLGIFLIVIEVLSFVNVYTFDSNFYFYFGVIIAIINILGLIIFSTIAFIKEDGKLIGSYLVLSIIYAVWVSGFVMMALSYMNLSMVQHQIMVKTIPLFLQYATLSLLLYLVLVESQKAVVNRVE